MNRSTALITALLVLPLLVLRPDAAPAHPHVLVKASAALAFDAARRFDTITVRYALDELTTAVLIEGLDKNGNGVFERDELKALAVENAEALAEFDWFVEVEDAAGRVPATEVTAFDYSYENEQMVLMLQLALERAVDPAVEAVSVRLYDPSFYVLVELVEEAPLLVSGVDANFCRVSISAPSVDGAGVSLSDAEIMNFDQSANIGRDYADEISLACGADG